MALIAKRYSEPFFYMDTFLSLGRLSDFISSIVEEENESKLWELWLHKITNKSFLQFKEEITRTNEKVENASIVETIKDSQSILNSIKGVE